MNITLSSINVIYRLTLSSINVIYRLTLSSTNMLLYHFFIYKYVRTVII
jgi:hypothetical protein